MHQLLAQSELTDDDLAGLYAYPPGPCLRANMVASADGAASLGGASAGLSSAADRHVFALLRTLADVILVGGATARTERYAPVRPRELWRHLRDGRAPTPPIAVLSARLDLDPASRLLAGSPPHARTIIITADASPPDRRAELAKHADIIMAGDENVDLKAAVAELAGRGYPRVLTEGGPHLLAQLLAADLLDELCLTVGPLMTGPGAGRIVAGAQAPDRPLPLRLAHAIEEDGFLLCRYTRKSDLSRTSRGACPAQALRAGQQAALETCGDGGGPVVDAELGVDVQQVGLDRGLADEQPGGRLAVRAAERDQAEYVQLTLAERLLGRLPDLAEQAGGDRGREHRLAAGRGADTAPQFVRRGVLEQVAGRPGLDRGHHVGVGVEGGEHKHPRGDAALGE
jgi:riboflavin biosynthesis pyrimidine reductase